MLKRLAAAALLTAALVAPAGPAGAAPVTYILTLQETNPANPGPTFEGTFVIDDTEFGVGGAVIPFDDFTSFQITAYGVPFVLTDAVPGASRGVVLNAAGDDVFDFTGAPDFAVFELGSPTFGTLGFSPQFTIWEFDVSSGTSACVNRSRGRDTCIGSYSIARAATAIPEPSTALLSAVGLSALVWLRRRQRRRP